MENEAVNYDLDSFADNFETWKDFVENGRWKEKVITPEQTYTSTLKNGSELQIHKFKIEDVHEKDYPYSDIWFMLGEVEGKIVGYSVLSLMVDNGAPVKVSTGDVSVLDRGIGVAGKLLRLRSVLLQEIANEKGDLDYLLVDNENSDRINLNLKEINKKIEAGTNTSVDLEQVKKMLVDRQKWLLLYGEGGKLGYRWDEDKDFLLKRFTKGEIVEQNEFAVSKNETNLREELKKWEQK